VRWLSRALCCALTLGSGVARAGPDAAGAVRALGATPFRVGGAAVGGSALLGAAALGTLGDALSLADANRWTSPILFGVGSGAVKRVALGLSQGGTGFLEGLRAEDVERLPEARAAYLGNAPFLGRLDTAWTGLGSLRLGAEDTFAGPALCLLRAVGARGPASSLAGFVRDERLRVLGPLVREQAQPEE
jgi:hypothetical protein